MFDFTVASAFAPPPGVSTTISLSTPDGAASVGRASFGASTTSVGDVLPSVLGMLLVSTSVAPVLILSESSLSGFLAVVDPVGQTRTTSRWRKIRPRREAVCGGD